MADVKLVVHEEPPIKIRVTDPVIKPTQTKTVTPAYEEQTVLPDAGYALGQVDVEAIPLPSGVIDIDENGEYEVAGYGTANVHVPQPSGAVDITENGTHDVTDFKTANVNIQPTLQSKTATPTEQAQTIRPDTGYDGLDRVDIERIPTEYIIPSGTKHITQNGVEDVREYDSVDVSVEPTLQDKTVTPTKQTQTVNADSGYDGLDTVEIEPIPSEYIVPQGKTIITQNGTVDVSQFSEAEVNVSSDPEFGFVLEGWDEKGQPTTLRLCGFTDPPHWYFYPFANEAVDNSRGYFCNRLTTVILNEGIVRIWYYVFRSMKTIQRVVFPSTIRTIQGWAFYGDNALSELDFSLATEIPTLDNPGQLTHATGCVIKVKQSLLAEWQSATNWNALTGVVWEGV